MDLEDYQFQWLIPALILALLLWWLALWQAHPVAGQTAPLVQLSEVHPAPMTGESEWVELYNPGDQDQELAGWTLQDQLSTPSVIHTFTTELIPAQSYLVVHLSSAKLNNSADGVTLIDQTGVTIDEFSYDHSQSGLSWALTSPDTWELTSPTPNQANPQPSPLPSPSPSPTPSPQPSPTPSPTSYNLLAITLSEIMPCPATGQPEWIELHNTSDRTIDLTNWLLKDATGPVLTLTQIIPASTYLQITLPTSRFNNDGDSVILETPTSQQVFSTEYDTCTKGLSLINHDGQWLPAEPTPAQPTA